MSLKAWIKGIIWKLTWRKELCHTCENLQCVSNFGPCYSCRVGSQYTEARFPADGIYTVDPCCVEHRGYQAIQVRTVNCHVFIYKGNEFLHSEYGSLKSEDELKKTIDTYIKLKETIEAFCDAKEAPG